jgi:hypothetical protein
LSSYSCETDGPTTLKKIKGRVAYRGMMFVSGSMKVYQPAPTSLGRDHMIPQGYIFLHNKKIRKENPDTSTEQEKGTCTHHRAELIATLRTE